MDELILFDQLSTDALIGDTKYVRVERMTLSCVQDVPQGIMIGEQSFISRADLCRSSTNFCCTDSGQDVMVVFVEMIYQVILTSV